MPGRYSKQGEIQQLQHELGNEIRRDAKPIADGVFGDNARHPDMASVSNSELDQIFLEAYRRNDREWLMGEARRDPQQFLDVTDRIGVPDPPVDMHNKPTGPDPNALQKVVQQNAQAASPPPIALPGAALPTPPPQTMATQMSLPGMPPTPGQPTPPTVTSA